MFLLFFAIADAEFLLTETPYLAPNLAVVLPFGFFLPISSPPFLQRFFLVLHFLATSNISANSCGVNTPLTLCSE